MKENRFDLNIDGVAATAYFPPDGKNVCSAMVVCHGWGGNRRLWRLPEKIKNKVVKRGMAVFSIDMYGCGDSKYDYKNMTYALWSKDIAAAVRYVREKYDINKVGVFGFSSGSTAAFRCAAETFEPDFIISVATCVTPNIGMAEGGPYADIPTGKNTRLFMGKDVGREFFVDCINNSPDKSLDAINIPVLILQGGADNKYRIDDAEFAAEKIKKSLLIKYDSGTHSLDNCATAAANDAVFWLEQGGFCRKERQTFT